MSADQSRQGVARKQQSPLATCAVAMFDPLATVPYYTAYLSRALLEEGVNLQIRSISYYLDAECFRSRNLEPDPGLIDVVGKLSLAPTPRRVLKLLELGVNLGALTLRPSRNVPAIVHVQFLPLLRSSLPIDLAFVRHLRRRGSRVVLTVHDLLPHDTADRFRETYQKLYTEVDALICHSGHVRSLLETEFGMPGSKISVIPHGPFFYDLPAGQASTLHERLGIPPDRRIVLWQGIIFPYKGLDTLLQAWQVVEQSHPEAQLLVMGTGSAEMLASVRRQAESLGLQHLSLDLRFCSTEELVEAYRAAEVVVYPYRAITTSGALATGLSLGKAIVASDLPVFRELLHDGENALLIPPQDADALARALHQLLDDESLRQRIAANVHQMHFGDASWRAIARDTLRVYEAVLQNTPHGSENAPNG